MGNLIFRKGRKVCVKPLRSRLGTIYKNCTHPKLQKGVKILQEW